MRALRFHRHGPSREALVVEDIPVPTPGPGEALVQVLAAGLNPSDAKNVEGAFPQTTLPRIPGRDFAGRVVAGSPAWHGKEVFGSGSAGLGYQRDGTHAEYVVVPEDGLAARPEALTPGQAATAGVPYTTAAEGLTRAGIRAGDRVLIVGGTGAVGRAVAQIAKWSGARVVATTLSTADADDAARRHVDAWIDLSREDLTQGARAATAGEGVDIAYNVVGGDTFGKTLTALAIGGRMVCISAPKDPMTPLDVRHLYRNNLQVVGVDSAKFTARDIAQILRRLAHGFDQGALVIAEPLKVPLANAIDAYAALGAGPQPKTVLVP
ncbi:MAG TPA: zinc-binding alcohol dehydrogenase family protein [Polyangiaceae bacterium]|jgi:NADPH2:quinone reductase|nr:zinc-binding alcohol dehydrogenase family protein [Polyangiaceae bacterium]